MPEDTIVFPCPACGTKYSVGPHHAGKKTTCKKCGAPVTVPTPQVANPTFIGGTRTIRRADIEAVSKQESSVQTAPEAAPEVDMKGGASVLRKEETLYGQQVPAEPSGGTRVPPPRRGTSAPAAPAPRPATAAHAPRGHTHAPHGAPAARKKSPLPLVLGIGGGVVGLVLVIVLIAVGTGKTSGGPQGGGPVAGAGNSPQGGGKSADEILLADLTSALNNVGGMKDSAEIEGYYKLAKEKKADPKFKTLADGFARQLAKKADGETPERVARVGLMLDNDGYKPEAAELLRKASVSLEAGRTVTRQREGRTVNEFVKNELYVEVVTRLGWKPYTRPAVFDDYDLLGIKEINEYKDVYAKIPEKSRDIGLIPPGMLDEIKAAEDKVRAAGKEIEDQHAKDGYAKDARKAFLRFLDRNKAGKVNRKKNQRPFSPEAMGRTGEKVEQIWTYTYWKPFIVFVERPANGEVDQQFLESLQSKSSLLKHLYDYFRVNLVDKFNLQRVKPRYNAEVAEREGWPLEIVVLKDRVTFEQFVEDVQGQPMPGARAFYSPLNEHVMTYDDTENQDPETAWFNESVLIHETFHLLSDHYAAGPMFSMEEIQERPRYTSVLVQEGLTDSVSGFTRTGGEGRDATYEFLTQNHLRLKDWQEFYKQIGNKMLFRIRDMLECRHYGQCRLKALVRWQELKLPIRSQGHANAIAQFGLGLYYASACQASYFFVHYREGGKYPYRDLWWQYLAKDYKGEIQLKSYDDNRAVDEFKKMFGIKSDKDWDALDKKFEDFTVALKPENVGRSGGPTGGPDDAGTILPGAPVPLPEPSRDGGPHSTREFALAGRD
ncbi:MAG: hypothetical protein HS108_03295 [Planctomycetes bacterium]|nr:hypothetical protein [Planctomycetota bacterium]